MNILLILPYDRVYRYQGLISRIAPYMPLTLMTLAALVPEELHAEIELVDEGVQPPCNGQKRYDVVGITCLTSSAPRAYELAKFWREHGAFVVLGGAHVSMMSEEAARHADAIVVGPGETSWPQLLRDWRSGTPQKIYAAEYPEQLSSPFPKRNLQRKHAHFLAAPPVLVNRGCQNTCHYCSIPALYNRISVNRPIDEVIEDIKRLKAKNILLFASTLSADKAYASELFEALIPLRIKWSSADTIDVAEDRAYLDLMVRSGCEGLLIGFESFGQQSLNTVGKRCNQVQRYRESVQTLHQYGLTVLGCFMLGFDHDTPDMLYQMPQLVDNIGVDVARYAIVTPFPGTPLFRRLKQEGRIFTEDWSWYDSGHVVFRPQHMLPETLQQAYYDIWRATYRLPRVLTRVYTAASHRGMILAAGLGIRLYANKLRDHAYLDFLRTINSNPEIQRRNTLCELPLFRQRTERGTF
ncbi:BchE/P-methylase family protein [Candidatus Moduliflexus flocculans]|uniref:BchE/P-methylase family protein n=1 Tax=Candidatus Moduliflexus flocculans TaxID=1499966 RepID=A0A0S6W0P0_9BACT|nr:BchE/P-methylase family protein [Candidatus Moduliflexus flocculans]